MPAAYFIIYSGGRALTNGTGVSAVAEKTGSIEMITIADDELRRWLAEDIPYGDLTTHALAIGNDRGRIRFEARQAMVAVCSEEAARIMTMAGANVIASAPSGTELQTAALLLAAEGPAAALHAGWKVSQTLLETTGGIAAAGGAIVEAARRVKPEIVVACTRKSIPGTRGLSIKAIVCGGAVPHRLGLSETILVFAQHRAFTGDASLAAIVDRLRRRAPPRRRSWSKATPSMKRSQSRTPAPTSCSSTRRRPKTSHNCGGTASPARRARSLPPPAASMPPTPPTTPVPERTCSSPRRRTRRARSM